MLTLNTVLSMIKKSSIYYFVPGSRIPFSFTILKLFSGNFVLFRSSPFSPFPRDFNVGEKKNAFPNSPSVRYHL